MAEAVVEIPRRFFCHMCNVEINLPTTDFICPICAGGFVEELPAQAAGAAAAANNTNAAAGLGAVSMGLGTQAPYMTHGSDLDALRREITQMVTRNGQNYEITFDPVRRRRSSPGSTELLTPSSSTSSGQQIGGGRVRPQNFERLDNVLMDFLQTLTGAEVNAPAGSHSNLLYMGNLGDYAWGLEGIDTIVTQLLNQVETSGPPPLAKDKIAAIPVVPISAEEVAQKLQCSVCWEDFKIDEKVRKLPCSHIYHEGCILPWLDLHGTCPICRKTIDNGDNTDAADVEMMPVTNAMGQQQQGVANAQGNAANNSGSTAAVSGGAVNANTNASQQQQFSNFFTFEDSHEDLD